MNVLNVNTSVESYPFRRTNAALITAAVVAIALTVIGSCALFPCVGAISGICTTYSGLLLGGIAALVYHHLRMPTTHIHLQHASATFAESFDATTLKLLLEECDLAGERHISITPFTCSVGGCPRDLDPRIHKYYAEGLLPPGRILIDIEHPEPITTVSFRCVTPSLLITLNSRMSPAHTEQLKSLIIRLGLSSYTDLSITSYELIADNNELDPAEPAFINILYRDGLLPDGRINIHIEQSTIKLSSSYPDEVWLSVFSKLKNRAALRQVSRLFYELSQDGSLFTYVSPARNARAHFYSHLCKNGRTIKALNLTGQQDNGRLPQQTWLIGSIPNFCPNLRSLDLSLKRMSLHHLRRVLQFLPHLEHLNVSDLYSQDDSTQSLEEAMTMPKLVNLTIGRYHSFNLAELGSFLSKFPNLAHLNLGRG